jgi:SAM-dependent methyltransferase
MKQIIKKIPMVNSFVRGVYRKWINPLKPFTGSKNYWIERYDSGGNSGDGSYHELAEFKAEILNDFVMQKDIRTVIEYGCGDGNQLKLAKYPMYIGFDVSPRAVSICKEWFLRDATKTFKVLDDYSNETADLTLSLDVIYHLIEDNVFIDYMNRLFDSSERFVVIYSSDTDANPEGQAAHVKHRNFTLWVGEMKSDWRLMKYIPNKYPYHRDTKTGSFSDFFIYEKV